MRLERWERPALLAVLVAALLLRLYHLNSPLWFDEVITLVEFVRAPVRALIADYSSFNNHLFYSLQAKLSVAIFGEHSWSVRLPAVLAGLGSIWLLWRLARMAVGSGEALVVAALMTLSYHHIWFSQNARGYTGMMFWSLAALLIFIEALGSRSWRRWGLFGVVLAAAVYTHVTALFFVAALGAVYVGAVVARRLERWGASPPPDPGADLAGLAGFCWGGLLTLLLCAPAIPQMLSLVGGVKTDSVVDVMQEYQNPIWTLIEGVRTAGSGGLLTLAAPAAGVLVVMGAVDIARRRPIITAVAALHVLFTMAALIVLSMHIWPRFFFTDIAFALLFLVRGVFLVCGWLANLAPRLGLGFATRARLTAAAAAAMVVASALLAVRNYTLPKQNLPAAVALIGKAGAPHSSVGAIGEAAEVFSRYPVTGWPTIQAAADLAKLRPHDGRRWLVMIFPNLTLRSHAELMRAVDRDFEIVQRFPGTLGDGDVWVYASKPSAMASR